MLQGHIKEALAIKRLNFPVSLFKYRQLNSNTLLGVLNGTVWAASAKNMNDPYESYIKVDHFKLTKHMMSKPEFWEQKQEDYLKLGISREMMETIRLSDDPLKGETELLKKYSTDAGAYAQLVSELDSRSHQSLNEQSSVFIDFLKEKVRFCSFSTVPESIEMWSHYGDSHKGICLEYSYKDEERLSDNTHPVLYSDNLFDATDYFIDKSKTALISVLSSIYKAKKWQYEAEWRFVMPNGLFDTDRAISIPRPKAIYVGSGADKETDPDKIEILSQILHFCDQNDIPKYKMKLRHDSHGLIPQII